MCLVQCDGVASELHQTPSPAHFAAVLYGKIQLRLYCVRIGIFLGSIRATMEIRVNNEIGRNGGRERETGEK